MRRHPEDVGRGPARGGDGGRERVGHEVRPARPEARHDRLVLLGLERAGRVDEDPAGPDQPRRGLEDARLGWRRASRSRRAAGATCRRGCGGGRRGSSTARRPGRGRTSARDPRRERARRPRAARRSWRRAGRTPPGAGRAGPRCGSAATSRPWLAMSAARCVVFVPGRRAHVGDRLPGQRSRGHARPGWPPRPGRRRSPPGGRRAAGGRPPARARSPRARTAWARRRLPPASERRGHRVDREPQRVGPDHHRRRLVHGQRERLRPRPARSAPTSARRATSGGTRGAPAPPRDPPPSGSGQGRGVAAIARSTPLTKAVAPADRRRLASSTASWTAAHAGIRSRNASW